MIYNKNVRINFSKKDEIILDSQSKICNWLYNRLFEIVEEDYKNGNEQKLLSGRNLRDLVPMLKEEKPFLKAVHSSPLKNTALRLLEAYKKFFRGECEHPHFRSWTKKWFSLYFDESKKGFKLLGDNILKISLGKSEEGKLQSVTGKFEEPFKLSDDEKIKTCRVCKGQGKQFYITFTIEKIDRKPKEIKTWLSIDPNHKNLFVAIDNEGNTFEFVKPSIIKYWDTQIDIIKSKRDKCKRKAKLIVREQGANYYLPSKRWIKLNNALNKAYNFRREQIKQMSFRIGNYIAKQYDLVVIGDYAPSLEVATYDNMHRSMLNQTNIGTVRKTIVWCMTKGGKVGITQDERNTTKTCCICGKQEKKNPEIREFTCSECGTHIHRDINSAINIVKKANILKKVESNWQISKPIYELVWNFKKCEIIKIKIA